MIYPFSCISALLNQRPFTLNIKILKDRISKMFNISFFTVFFPQQFIFHVIVLLHVTILPVHHAHDSVVFHPYIFPLALSSIHHPPHPSSVNVTSEEVLAS